MSALKTYGARGALSDPPQLGESVVVLAYQAEAAIAALIDDQVKELAEYDAQVLAAEQQGQADMLAKCIEAVRAVEGGYSVPLGMSVGQFIEAMRHQFIAVLRDLEETL